MSLGQGNTRKDYNGVLGNKSGKLSLEFFKWIRNCICKDQRKWHCNAFSSANFSCVQEIKKLWYEAQCIDRLNPAHYWTMILNRTHWSTLRSQMWNKREHRTRRQGRAKFKGTGQIISERYSQSILIRQWNVWVKEKVEVSWLVTSVNQKCSVKKDTWVMIFRAKN